MKDLPVAMTASGSCGLSHDEVAQAVKDGKVNKTKLKSSRSVTQIICANIFTLFNAILTAALVIVLLIGHPQDAVFGIVMVVNSLTGIIAELKAKRMLDGLSMLGQAEIEVIRKEGIQTLKIDKIVLGDLIVVKMGDQIPADCVVIESDGLELDESMLTGESYPQPKRVGDKALSGAAVVTGRGILKTIAVGQDAYIQKLGNEVKQFTRAHSELAAGINWILRWIARGLPVIVVLLVWSQLREAGGYGAAIESGSWRTAVILAIAGVVGMIPQGLVLLTSVNFATAGLQLARRGVLVQELPAVEILARVSTICLDKTGTLTTGGIVYKELKMLPVAESVGVSEQECIYALAALSSDRTNATAEAIADSVDTDLLSLVQANTCMRIPFNSARKWSGVLLGERTWIMGAPDILARSCRGGDEALQIAKSDVEAGHRVIGVALASQQLDSVNPQLDEGTATLVAVVVLEEQLRIDAADTLRYFGDQGVTVKVISGDNPRTVAALGARLGINGGNPRWVDAIDLPAIDDPRFADEIFNHDVFGRVTPEQKRAMVTALQSRDEVVAMTGDGVNDALALKKADLGIAMGSGTAATKAAAKVVLIDGHFSCLPAVVAQGRRVLANMERVAALFLAKTSYALLIAVLVSITAFPYPFLPRHLTIIGSLSIGIPAFFLALAPSNRRYRPGFLKRTLELAVPSGLVIGAISFITFLVLGGAHASSTATTLVTLISALTLLATVSRPLRSWRGGLLVAMVGLALIILLFSATRHFFALVMPSYEVFAVVVIAAAVAGTIIVIHGVRWAERNMKIEPVCDISPRTD